MKSHLKALTRFTLFSLLGVEVCSAQIRPAISPIVPLKKVDVPVNLKAAMFLFPTEQRTLPLMILSNLPIASDSDGLDPNEGGFTQNDEKEESFPVSTSGQISVDIVLTSKNIFNEKVPRELIFQLVDPTGKVVAEKKETKIWYGLEQGVRLSAFANDASSGCFDLRNPNANRWKLKIKGGLLFMGTVEARSTVTVPSTKSNRSVYPQGAYTLNANGTGDFVFASPKNQAGKLEITVTYTGTAPLEARLFKPGVEPSANEANALLVKQINASTYKFTQIVTASDQVNEDSFWKVRLRNKGTGNQVINDALISVKFSTCEQESGK